MHELTPEDTLWYVCAVYIHRLHMLDYSENMLMIYTIINIFTCVLNN